MKKVCIIIPPAPGLADQRTNIPLGPLSVAAQLEYYGHEVTLVSLLGHPIPASWPKADLYAMGFTTPQIGAAVGIMNLIRSQYPDATVLAAGAHPTFCYAETLALGFDVVLRGEAENDIFEVLYDLPYPRPIYTGMPYDSLALLRPPAWHLLPEEDLRNNAASVFCDGEIEGHVACIMYSRGCPCKCAFCGNSPLSNVVRFRSPQDVCAEMAWLHERGVRYFKFQDDNFGIQPKELAELSTEIARTFSPGSIATRVHTRADLFFADMIPRLKAMYVDLVGFGIESGSQEILNLSRKKISVEQNALALRMAHDAGFRTLGFFMFGLPGEERRTVYETLSFIERNRPYLDHVDFSIFAPYPGSDIADHPAKYDINILDHDYNHYWITQKRGILALPYGVSFDEMMKLKDIFMKALRDLGYAKPEWEHDW